MLKVFEINEGELIAAKNKEQAVDFYKKQIDSEVVSVEERDLDKNKLRYLIDTIKTLDKIDDKILRGDGEIELKKGSIGCEYGWYVELTYREILQLNEGEEPYVFASSEC